MPTIDFFTNFHFCLDTGRNMPTWNSTLLVQSQQRWFVHERMQAEFSPYHKTINIKPLTEPFSRFMSEDVQTLPTLWTCGRNTALSKWKQLTIRRLFESKYCMMVFFPLLTKPSKQHPYTKSCVNSRHRLIERERKNLARRPSTHVLVRFYLQWSSY